MIILVSTSMRFYERLLPVAEKLRELGHEVNLPEKNLKELNKSELILRHLTKLRESDTLLLGNSDGYIGASTFFEAGWAFALDKPIFALEKLDEESDFTEDLRAIGVVELENNFDKLKEEN